MEAIPPVVGKGSPVKGFAMLFIFIVLVTLTMACSFAAGWYGRQYSMEVHPIIMRPPPPQALIIKPKWFCTKEEAKQYIHYCSHEGKANDGR